MYIYIETNISGIGAHRCNCRGKHFGWLIPVAAEGWNPVIKGTQDPRTGLSSDVFAHRFHLSFIDIDIEIYRVQ